MTAIEADGNGAGHVKKIRPPRGHGDFCQVGVVDKYEFVKKSESITRLPQCVQY